MISFSFHTEVSWHHSRHYSPYPDAPTIEYMTCNTAEMFYTGQVMATPVQWVYGGPKKRLPFVCIIYDWVTVYSLETTDPISLDGCCQDGREKATESQDCTRIPLISASSTCRLEYTVWFISAFTFHSLHAYSASSYYFSIKIKAHTFLCLCKCSYYLFIIFWSIWSWHVYWWPGQCNWPCCHWWKRSESLS